LAAAFSASDIPVLEGVVRQTEGHRPDRYGVSLVTPSHARYDAEVLWICVPDDEIAAVAHQIATQRGDLRGQLVVHSSGALTIAALEAAQQAGAAAGTIAPIYSFPTREPVALRGILFAVESAPETWPALASLVEMLGGRPLRIASENKVLYHAAATLASPLLISAMHAAVATAELAGLTPEDAKAMIGTLVQTTMRNYFEKGSDRSFSGAFARGDARTVELHLEALQAHPTVRKVYQALALHAVDSLPVRKKIEIEELLRDRTIGADKQNGGT
jgi:predicted short-subunit dehydrogenase-like oxidoreductase (DUF2520 family)